MSKLADMGLPGWVRAVCVADLCIIVENRTNYEYHQAEMMLMGEVWYGDC